MSDEIDTTNDHLVGAGINGGVSILFPPAGPMEKHEALRLAAWIVALADNGPSEEFPAILKAVQNT